MYTVVIDELVFKKDFKKINRTDQKRIIRAIRQKLTTQPEVFGSPLSGDFFGLWKLRVGPYRIIYEIEKKKVRVYIIMVGFRRDAEVYKKLISRLKLK
ncbi:MAG: plasmid stabilization protein [Candidatus Aminicenantes bacterium]|nr:MAG: plasmid stabilization protein [Candidatus Aminicenantes bacterium]